MKRAILFSLFLLSSIQIYSCSSFFINHKDQKILCFNWDWPLNGDGYVFINQPNVKKRAFLLDSDKTLTWTSKYGSVTFNQIGRELPYCGLNQAGLAIAAASNNRLIYPEKNDKYALNESQWIQYLLDNCKTIDEVIDTDSLIQIVEENAPIHYILADKSGNAAIVEFVDGQLKVYRNAELPFAVLTNDFYVESIEKYKNELETNTKNNRFTKAVCQLNELAINDSINDYIDYSFNTLNRIEQRTTKWQIVIDMSNLEVYFNTSEAKYVYMTLNEDGTFSQSDKKTEHKARVGSTKSERTNISFSSFDLNCDNQILFADLNTHNTQDVYSDLKIYIENIDEKKIYETIKLFQKLGFMKHISKKEIREYIDFTKEYECK